MNRYVYGEMLQTFLEKRGVFDKFKKNLQWSNRAPWEEVWEHHIDYCDQNPLEAISSAFSWDNTEEDHAFWRDISLKWKRYFHAHK